MSKRLIVILTIFSAISAAHSAYASDTREPVAENAVVQCEQIKGVFLFERVGAKRILNTFIMLKDVSEPLRYTDEVTEKLQETKVRSDIEVGCLGTAEGVAIRYKTESNVSHVIQIDNNGRLLTYAETPGFVVNTVKSFKM